MNIHKPLLFWCSPLVQSLTHRQSRHNLKSPANHRVILGRTLRDPGGLHGTFMFFLQHLCATRTTTGFKDDCFWTMVRERHALNPQQ